MMDAARLGTSRLWCNQLCIVNDIWHWAPWPVGTWTWVQCLHGVWVGCHWGSVGFPLALWPHPSGLPYFSQFSLASSSVNLNNKFTSILQTYLMAANVTICMWYIFSLSCPRFTIVFLKLNWSFKVTLDWVSNLMRVESHRNGQNSEQMVLSASIMNCNNKNIIMN